MNTFFSDQTNTGLPDNLQNIPLNHFFPEINGNIGNYKVALPIGYIGYDLDEFGAEGLLWGEEKDIQFITSSDETLKIEEANHPVIRVRFTGNVAVANGKLIDKSGPISETSLSSQKITDLQIVSGYVHGIRGVPAIAYQGMLNDIPIYMVYFYSPMDNLVVLSNLQGGKNKDENDFVWKHFIKGLEIKEVH